MNIAPEIDVFRSLDAGDLIKMRELSLKNTRLDRRYDVLDQLGRGSYAEIYLARDTIASPQSPHIQVVIKALNVYMQNDLDADLERTLVENFQNEAVALDRVRHPNVVSRLGHGTAKDLRGAIFHYLVLEYLSGGDLAKRCRNSTLSIGESLNYIDQVCAGLAHAHRHGVIHRDIKPQNVLLTADLKTAKIADFGVARFSASDPITRVGTNIFAPPEYSPLLADDADSTTAELTPAADIYPLAKTPCPARMDADSVIGCGVLSALKAIDRVIVVGEVARERARAVAPRYEVEVVARLRLHRSAQRSLSGEGNRRRRQAGTQIGVVGVVGLKVALAQTPLETFTETVDHRRVGLQPHADTQAVAEHRSDQRAFAGLGGFLLDDGGKDQRRSYGDFNGEAGSRSAHAASTWRCIAR